MARPQTKSPPIHFRIDITLWPELEARAARYEQSIGDFVRDRIEASLRRTPQDTAVPTKLAAPKGEEIPASPDEILCPRTGTPHKFRIVGGDRRNFGVRKCIVCGEPG